MFGGDFDGDGRGDIALVRDDGGNTTRVFVLRSSRRVVLGADALWWSSGASRWDARASKFAVGDLTGDGKADLACSDDVGRGTSKLWVLRRPGAAFSLQLDAVVGLARRLGLEQGEDRSADVNGDRKGDVVHARTTTGARRRSCGRSSRTAPASRRAKVYWASAPRAGTGSAAKLGAGDFDHEGATTS